MFKKNNNLSLIIALLFIIGGTSLSIKAGDELAQSLPEVLKAPKIVDDEKTLKLLTKIREAIKKVDVIVSLPISVTRGCPVLTISWNNHQDDLHEQDGFSRPLQYALLEAATLSGKLDIQFNLLKERRAQIFNEGDSKELKDEVINICHYNHNVKYVIPEEIVQAVCKKH